MKLSRLLKGLMKHSLLMNLIKFLMDRIIMIILIMVQEGCFLSIEIDMNIFYDVQMSLNYLPIYYIMLFHYLIYSFVFKHHYGLYFNNRECKELIDDFNKIFSYECLITANLAMVIILI
jgi:hypothetical protein